VEALAEGFIHIANERMAEAITLVSTRRGYNPREYALLCFGGGGRSSTPARSPRSWESARSSCRRMRGS
jgi:N-methylhydantoinase A/oxoprolinase/acetone carboxylase beta subunit